MPLAAVAAPAPPLIAYAEDPTTLTRRTALQNVPSGPTAGHSGFAKPPTLGDWSRWRLAIGTNNCVERNSDMIRDEKPDFSSFRREPTLFNFGKEFGIAGYTMEGDPLIVGDSHNTYSCTNSDGKKFLMKVSNTEDNKLMLNDVMMRNCFTHPNIARSVDTFMNGGTLFDVIQPGEPHFDVHFLNAIPEMRSTLNYLRDHGVLLVADHLSPIDAEWFDTMMMNADGTFKITDFTHAIQLHEPLDSTEGEQDLRKLKSFEDDPLVPAYFRILDMQNGEVHDSPGHKEMPADFYPKWFNLKTGVVQSPT